MKIILAPQQKQQLEEMRDLTRLLFIGSDSISVTFGELFISHNFSLLGGRKNRDYDSSLFYL
jgi:hypothetical protein